jgi:hypothetical protein
MGLVVGIDKDGKDCDARISLEELRSRITFTRRKFQGFDVKQGRGLVGEATVEMLRITPKVPLIDGQTEGDRPASWDAKTLSGRPLITDEQIARLMAGAANSPFHPTDVNLIPVVKIFLPHVRWLLVHGYHFCREACFGVTKRGPDMSVGPVGLSDIVNARLGELRPEQDLYITLDKPWIYYVRHPDAW